MVKLFGTAIIILPVCFAFIGGILWGDMAAFIGFIAPIVLILSYSKLTDSKYKKMFSDYAENHGLSFDIFELCDRSGYAVDLNKKFFVFKPKHQRFKIFQFDEITRVRWEQHENKTGLMTFSVKDINDPHITINFPSGVEKAFARLQAAGILS